MLLTEGYQPISRRGPRSSRSGPPSILDSPTLARVERCRIREEMEQKRGNNVSNGQYSPGIPSTLSSYCPSMISDASRESHAIKKGLLWQQRDRLFARWKERYFILTKDYLHCFKRSSGGSDKISDMGQFIFKVKLVDVEKVEWINKRSYSIICLNLQDNNYKIMLRSTHGLEDWFELLEECTMLSKERRKTLHQLVTTDNLWTKPGYNTSNANDLKNYNINSWLLNRTNPALNMDQSSLSESVPDLQQEQTSYAEESWRKRIPNSYQQRLSLLTDIDINNCDSPSNHSTTRNSSYKCTNDHYYEHAEMREQTYRRITPLSNGNRSSQQPPSMSSFRTSNLYSSPMATRERYSMAASSSPLQIRYRDRSQSDAFDWKIGQPFTNRRSYISQHPTKV